MASGFNMVDFMDLPPLERCVVRLILREVTMTYPQLCDAVTTLPADQQMDQPKLDSVLEQLTQNNWLLRESDQNQLSYRVNSSEQTRRQAGVSPDITDRGDMLTLKRGHRGVPNHVWDCLTTDAPEQQAPPPKPMRRSSLFDKLTDDDNASKEQ